MTSKNTFQSIVPPTLAEAAVAAPTWERVGILGRLVRFDRLPAPLDERRRARPTRLEV